MSKLCIRYFTLALMCCLSACSLFQPTPQNLLTHTSDTQTIVAQQQWQLIHQQERYLVQVFVERSADHWQWVLMSNLGQRLVTASATNGVINIEQHQSHPALQWLPELLEAFQLSYWPLADLQGQATKGWKIDGNSAHREALASGILRAAVDYSAGNPWQTRLNYDNKKRNLQLVIESQLLN
jgi:Protein of unknown function (DUF3261)